jgi:hypothetical protein
MRTQMQVYGDNIRDVAVGARVAVFAKVLAIRFSQINNLDMVKASLLAERRYLSFDRFDTEDEWEIADSDFEPVPDGSSTERSPNRSYSRMSELLENMGEPGTHTPCSTRVQTRPAGGESTSNWRGIGRKGRKS